MCRYRGESFEYRWAMLWIRVLNRGYDEYQALSDAQKSGLAVAVEKIKNKEFPGLTESARTSPTVLREPSEMSALSRLISFQTLQTVRTAS